MWRAFVALILILVAGGAIYLASAVIRRVIRSALGRGDDAPRRPGGR